MARSERQHLLVVEDEPVTRALLVAYLEQAGFEVSAVGDGNGLRAVLAARPVDVVLLDVELPGGRDDGFQLVPEIRAASSAGIIFTTRRADVIDRVLGLELGADDYVVKPPEMRELVARVRAVLRRRGGLALAEARRFGEWSLDRARRCLVSPRGEGVPLTEAEASILDALLDAGGRIVPRAKLGEVLRGVGAGENPRSLDVLVSRLRRKLGEGGAIEPRVLLTVHNVGYRIAVELG